MADLEEIIEIRNLPIKSSPSDNDYLVVDDETLTNRVRYSAFKENVTKDVADNLASEITARETADKTLQSNIDTESKARSTADTTLQTNIGNETKARQNADTTLQTNINTEVSNRQTADKQLQSSIEQEETNRQLADTSLENSINKCKKVFEYLNPTDTTYLIKHDLSTKDFLINVYSINGADLQPTIYRLDGNNVKLAFNDIPSSFRVVIFAINEWALSKLAFNLGGKEWL